MASKYGVLRDHLQASADTSLQMQFSEVAALVGALPASAREHREWWSNNESHTHARNGWLAAGWKTTKVDMKAEQLTFVRAPDAVKNSAGPVGVGVSLRPSARPPYPDSDQSALSQLEQRAGGAANLLEILRAVERYVEGEIVETELGRVIRRFWGPTA